MVQVVAAEVLYCTLYEDAPLIAPQLSVADVEAIDVADKLAGVPQDVPPLGGTHPSELAIDARAPPGASTAFIRADCPSVKIFMQLS